MSFVDRLFVVDVGSWPKVTKNFFSYHLFHCYLSTSSKYRLNLLVAPLPQASSSKGLEGR